MVAPHLSLKSIYSKEVYTSRDFSCTAAIVQAALQRAKHPVACTVGTNTLQRKNRRQCMVTGTCILTSKLHSVASAPTQQRVVVALALLRGDVHQITGDGVHLQTPAIRFRVDARRVARSVTVHTVDAAVSRKSANLGRPHLTSGESPTIVQEAHQLKSTAQTWACSHGALIVNRSSSNHSAILDLEKRQRCRSKHRTCFTQLQHQGLALCKRNCQ